MVLQYVSYYFFVDDKNYLLIYFVIREKLLESVYGVLSSTICFYYFLNNSGNPWNIFAFRVGELPENTEIVCISIAFLQQPAFFFFSKRECTYECYRHCLPAMNGKMEISTAHWQENSPYRGPPAQVAPWLYRHRKHGSSRETAKRDWKKIYN